MVSATQTSSLSLQFKHHFLDISLSFTMFKKKPTIKPLAPLRSSDRRKLSDQIIKDYGIQSQAVEEQTEEQKAEPPTAHTNLPNSHLITHNLHGLRQPKDRISSKHRGHYMSAVMRTKRREYCGFRSMGVCIHRCILCGRMQISCHHYIPQRL